MPLMGTMEMHRHMTKAYCDKIIWLGSSHGKDMGMSCLMVRGCKYPEKLVDCPASNKKALCPYTITGTV
jgi:hypothetical protein